jgi:hypothetical protein
MKNPDNFGFYRIGDFKFYSKLEAMEMHARTGMHPHWDFNEAVFSSYDWTVDPSESLPELYRQRAQQLRDEYDHLVLWYSGGADCNNVLNSFIDNDIKIDEVASFVNYEATKEQINFLNAEVFEVAGPKIAKAKIKQPDLLHRVVDLCQPTIDEFESGYTKFDWIYHFHSVMTVNAVARDRIVLAIDEWKHLIDQGKKVGFIWGCDKPRVFQTAEGNYVFKFLDITDTSVGAGAQMRNEPWNNPEFFYWNPDLPKIVIKQAHIIKNYLKHATSTSTWMTEHKSDMANKKIDGKLWWLSMDGVHSLIYPGWYPVPYQFKPKSPLFSPRDNWFMDMNDGNESWRIWRNGLEKRWQLVDDYWKNDVTDMAKGYKSSWSREYNLGV